MAVGMEPLAHAHAEVVMLNRSLGWMLVALGLGGFHPIGASGSDAAQGFERAKSPLAQLDGGALEANGLPRTFVRAAGPTSSARLLSRGLRFVRMKWQQLFGFQRRLAPYLPQYFCYQCR